MTYICPMHPNIKQDKPGMCPECGMSLVKAKSEALNPKSETNHKHQNHNKHEWHHTEDFLKKFWISLVLTVPIVLTHFFDFGFLSLEIGNWKLEILITALLGSVVFWYAGWVFLASAYREIRAKLPGMMTLIALAVISAYSYSVYVTWSGSGEMPLYWELTTLITIMLLGHWIEMRAVSGAQGALKELSKLMPDEKVNVGDIVTVKPGGRVPADGVVVEGESEVNEAMITGESAPVAKSTGSNVIAGTINGDGAFRMKVTEVGERTFLAGVMRLVREAQASKSRLQMLSDKAALYLTVIAVLAAIITAIAWASAGATVATVMSFVVAVLVIACPHALGLAVPLVASISTTMAARNGFLVKQRLALEAARNIDVVLFDKTGTLTEGTFGVTSFSSDEALALAASVDAHSEHPIALGIVAEAKKRNLTIKESKNFKRIPGVGGEAEVNGKIVFVGHRGGADIIVEMDGKKVGTIQVADKVRPEAKEALAKLKEMGLKLAMITGDSEEVAKKVSDELGIDEYFARVMPGDKSKIIENWKLKIENSHKSIAFVGDGINDAPALTQADVGIAIGAGTNVAIESAGIILMRSDPRDIAKIIHLSRLTYSKMIQNLWWAAGYNIVALPLAAGALAWKGVILVPAVAAILMSLSTVIVAINALLLRKRVL
ncbi:MAG: copper-translocating P-type ATPase [Patescibacteria group bacterium]